MLVLLRLALGWHFLYEGVWKVKHPDEFAMEAEGFLTGARARPVRSSMPWCPTSTAAAAALGRTEGRGTGRRRDEAGSRETGGEGGRRKRRCQGRCQGEEEGRPAARCGKPRANASLAEPAAIASSPGIPISKTRPTRCAVRSWRPRASTWPTTGPRSGRTWPPWTVSRKANAPAPAFQEHRDWDSMRKLRSEAKVWLTELDAREKLYKEALGALAEQKEGDLKEPLVPGWNPFRWTRLEQIRFAITWGLTAIGLCLISGFCTRLSALGGAVFMFMVVLSQPSYPGVIPADPPQLGHALLINKDFIEMLALFLLATTGVGRWGGLDYFVHKIFGPCAVARGTRRRKCSRHTPCAVRMSRHTECAYYIGHGKRSVPTTLFGRTIVKRKDRSHDASDRKRDHAGRFATRLPAGQCGRGGRRRRRPGGLLLRLRSGHRPPGARGGDRHRRRRQRAHGGHQPRVHRGPLDLRYPPL